jgi:hypothetical protein
VSHDLDLQVLDRILEPMRLNYNIQVISSFCYDHQSSTYRNSHQLNTIQIPEMKGLSAQFLAPEYAQPELSAEGPSSRKYPEFTGAGG